MLETMKVVGTDTDFIIINTSDFDPTVHTVYEEGGGMTAAQLKSALADAGIGFPKTANKAALQALFDALPPKE